ncbi:MAG: glycosyltransferase family 4 protein [candidate division WOR-3 bacterium]|nr:MAG: glycosyltransferase family 4 protein [candidate division WOR-3 bacterium]
MRNDLKHLDEGILKSKICLFGDLSSVHLRRWAIALRNAGCNLSIISYRKAALDAVRVYDISCSSMRGKPRYEKYLRLLRGVKMVFLLRRAIRQIKPDILHVHYLVNTPLALAFWRIRKLVVSPWGNDIIYDHGREPLALILYKKALLKWAKRITATTEFLAWHIQRYVKRTPKVIPFGVETDLFKRRRSRKQNIIVISFIKHLKEKYGPRFLLMAVPHLLKRTRNIAINIVGTGPQDEYLKKLAADLKIEKYVNFLGGIPHGQVVEILEDTDIFVMPSVYESEVFGVAAIEASAMEIPIVASDLGGIREAVRDGVTGILVPPRDECAIADACLTLIKDPSLRRKLGRNGRKFVTAEFEWSNCVEKMIQVYQGVLEER